MPNITEEKWIEMLEKKADGTYIIKYPKVKSKSGVTFDEHLTESTQNAHLAKNIGIEDTAGNFTATDVEGALNELFTNVSNGKQLVGGAITDVDDSVVIPADPSFNDLANAIRQISTGADISNLSPGNIVIFKHSGFSSYSGTSTAYQKMRAYTIRFGGGIRLSFTMKTGSGTYGGDMYAQVYINDEPVGIRRSKTGNTAEEYTFTEDFDGLKEGDEISIYARKTTSAVHIYVGEVEFKAATNVYIV